MQVSLAIIDDDRQLLSLIGTHFEQYPGFAPPMLFADGKVALQKLARRKVDIALVDLLLPGDSGLRVIRRIAEKGLARQIIASVTSDGGFPPFLLDPIDFAGVYAARKAQGEGQGVVIGNA